MCYLRELIILPSCRNTYHTAGDSPAESFIKIPSIREPQKYAVHIKIPDIKKPFCRFRKLPVLLFIEPLLFLVFPNRCFARYAHKAFPSGMLLSYAATD